MESENTQSGDLYTLLGWLEKNRNMVIGVAVGLVLIGIVYFYHDYHQSQKAIEAGQELSAAVLANGGASTDALLKVANDNGGTDAGARALLTAAGKQFVDGKIDDAKASFQRFVSDYPESPLMSQAKYGIAVCLEAQGKTSEATTAFKEVMDRYAGENTTMPAKFALARIYEADGKLEQARDYYMDLAQGRSTFGMEAGNRVTALIQKHPNLRPTAPPATSRPTVAPAP
jgi:predicted negative regulator of RcsB-dependent stress response